MPSFFTIPLMTLTSVGLTAAAAAPAVFCAITCMRVLATSIGETQALANIAAAPPHTKGCALLAKLLFAGGGTGGDDIFIFVASRDACRS